MLCEGSSLRSTSRVHDGLRVNLLHEGHFEIGRLPFKVFPDFFDLLFGGFQHAGLGFHGWVVTSRCKGFAQASMVVRCHKPTVTSSAEGELAPSSGQKTRSSDSFLPILNTP